MNWKGLFQIPLTLSTSHIPTVVIWKAWTMSTETSSFLNLARFERVNELETSSKESEPTIYLPQPLRTLIISTLRALRHRPSSRPPFHWRQPDRNHHQRISKICLQLQLAPDCLDHTRTSQDPDPDRLSYQFHLAPPSLEDPQSLWDAASQAWDHWHHRWSRNEHPMLLLISIFWIA